jgi:hypothetical protein
MLKIPNSNLKLILFGCCFILSLAPIGIETDISWNISNLLNLFRLFIPILIFLLLLIFYYKKIKIKKLRNNFFIFIYFFIIFIATLLNLQNFKDINKLLLPFYCMNYIFLSLLMLNIYDFKKQFNKFIFLQFIIITGLTTFTLLNFFYSFLNLNLPDFYNLKLENNFYNQNSNGLSRILLIISLFIFFINKRNNYLYFSCLIINTLIILLQSKLVIFFVFILILGKILLEKTVIKKKAKQILCILALPISISFFISTMNANETSIKMRFIQETKEDLNNMHLNQKLDIKILAGLKTRIDTWKEILNNSKKPLIGYGSQADKNLTKNLPSHTQLASNSLIYSYACAGLLGVVTLIIIYYNLLKLLCGVAILNKKKNKLNNLQIFFAVVLFFLIIRSIFENSFALWGIDFILMVNTYLALKNSFTKKI